jgi:hypothetical protein
MFGHASIAEAPFADVGGIVRLGVAEMNALATSSSIGVGTLVGTISLNGNFTQTTEVNTKASGVIDISSFFTQTTENIKIVNFTEATLSSAFTQSGNGIMIGSGVATTNLNMTQTSSGDLLYENINAGATEEQYTTISPSGTESWTTVTPSGSETWTEIEA